MSAVPSCDSTAPQVKIIEQPSSKGTRFRYECEGRFNNISGASGTNTYPTIRVINYSGPMTIIVSCVSKDPPYQPHPYKLANKNDLHKHGVCYFRLQNHIHDISFEKLSINCVTKKNIEESLTERERIQIDPFKTGFMHKLKPENIDLSCVRLCFQVRLETPHSVISLDPAISDPVYDKRTTTDLKICWLSHNSATVAGGKQMCILCEKVAKTDIEVRFYKKDSNWEATGILVTPTVFRQVAIVFETPEYRTAKCSPDQIREPVEVQIQLRRISDGGTSKPKRFQLLPIGFDNYNSFENHNSLKRKREKYNEGMNGSICRQLQAEIAKKPGLINLDQHHQLSNKKIESWELPPNRRDIKTESWKLVPCHEPIISQSKMQCFPQVNNCMNISRDKSVMEIASTNNKWHCNIQAVQNDVSKQHQKYNSTDTLNSDSWIKDLLEMIDEEGSVTELDYNPTTVNRIAHEPETNFITPDLNKSSSNCYENMVNIDNMLSSNTQQMDNFLNKMELMEEASYPNSLNDLSISDLIKDTTSESKNSNENVEYIAAAEQDYNKLRKEKIQDFIYSLNDLYKRTTNNINLPNIRNINDRL